MRGSERFLALALGCLSAGAVLADEPARWLERMNQALTSRNYDGTFSHWHGGQVEMLRIIHRVQDGTVSERLASLDGSGREFIRSGASLACYLPDKRTVVVEQRSQQQPLVGFPAVSDQTASFYDIKEVARTRLNRRDTHVITVTPHDEYRYGYRLWIDDSTAMPLKTQLCDAHGNVIEQIVFASLTLSAHIADAAFKPAFSTEGFQWVRDQAPVPAPSEAAQAWAAATLPPGFHMTVRSAQTLPGSPQPVDHLVFTDGMASVSVFVEMQQSVTVTPGPQSPPVSETATVGSSSAFSTVVDGHKITAVGEVPPATVQFIATQVKAQGAAPTGPPGPLSAVVAGRLTVVQRHECELCEEMLAAIARLGRERPLPPVDVVDVDSDPTLRRRHGLDVPVLLLDGTVVCRHRLDREELERLLRAPPAVVLPP